MLYCIKKSTAVISLSVLSFSIFAQKKELTEEQYVKGNFKGILQPLPIVRKWIDDTHFVLGRDNKNYVVDCKTGIESLATDEQMIEHSGQFTAVFYQKNDLYIKQNGVEVQLTTDKDQEVNPTMSPDGNHVAYTKNNDLYILDISTKKEIRITNDGTESIMNGYASWVYTEEILGRASRYRTFWWSPDSKRIAFFRTDDTPVPVFTITDGTGQHGYVEKLHYPKVGDSNPEVSIGIVALEDNKIVWADFDPKADQYFGSPYWTNDGSALWVQWMNRGQDNLKLFAVNLANGSKKEVYDEKQKTWIQLEDGYQRIHFLSNNKNLILESDKTGWNHLYFYDLNGKEINSITKGKYTVTGVEYIDEKNKVVYFTARSKENTARKDLYRIDLSGKNLQRLTFGEFNHSVNISPRGAYFTTTYNNVSTPSKMNLLSNKGKLIKELGDAKGADFEGYVLAKTDLIRVKSDDGIYDLPMKVTWPVNMDKNKKYPVLISIYGGPNAGTVMDSWSLNAGQQWYAKEEMIQVAMDHRASGHFGKEGQNFIHRNLGYWEMKDYKTLANWLVANGNADPAKIAITGFSYGGYLSSYALTYGADVFTHGMAGGSVTDWSYYDSHYTERFMDTPAENPEGYKSSSVLTHAEKYKGMLQIVHGMIDDNVHIQNSVNLISKLQDLKKNFEFMEYSGGRHGWGGNKGIHYANLKTQFIYKYLLEKPVNPSVIR
jgi:dipeptidyl-peptidase-4